MVVSITAEQRLLGREDDKRHVVFLDIDGVLQPCTSQKRFEHDISQTQVDMAKRMKDDRYLELDKYDVAAVLYDWDEKAIGNLRRLLDDCDAEIVISSDWKRTKTLEQLKLLFKIHNLDGYVTDVLSYTFHSFKKDEIREYLIQHPNLESYVVLDDLDMEKYYRGHMVCMKGYRYFTEKHMQEAARILRYGPWWSDYYIKNTSPDKLGRDSLIYDNYKKVIFLDIDGVLNDDKIVKDEESPIIADRFMYNLKTIIENTGAEVVLSSSWRSSYAAYAYKGFSVKNADMEALLECLDYYGVKIAGATPCIFNGPEGRPFEIRSWLCHRPDVENFVILDDEEFWKWNWLESHVVYTTTKYGEEYDQYKKGLTEKLAQDAIKILNGM